VRQLQQKNIVLPALFNDDLWPDAGLDLTDVGFLQEEHANP